MFLANTAAQSNTRPTPDYNFSPQAYNMTLAGKVQPDLNSGKLNVNLPIYTWEDQDFQLPVSLSYSTNGFKPNSPIGPVGLGWSINIGGVITRQIIGKDDLLSRGYYYRNIGSYDVSDMYQLTLDFATNDDFIMYETYETTPDVFHFSFGSHSGTFTLNEDGDFVVYGTNGDSGTYNIEYSDSYFIIETADGYRYRFGYDPKTREELYDTNPIYYTLPNINNAYVTSKSVIAWHLDRIVAPNGRILEFSYQSANSNLVIPLETDDVSTSFSQGNYMINSETVYKHASMTTVSYLESIAWKKNINSSPISIVELEYSNRSFKEVDANDTDKYKPLVSLQKKLDKVSFKDHAGNQLYSAEFDFTYKNSRMLLSGIYISNVGRYDMEYNLSIGGYMPGLISNAIDFWGFYNGVHSNTDNDYSPMGIDMNYNEYIEDSYKNPNYLYSKAGTLKRLTYPTGGHTEFEYEPNTAQYIMRRNRNGSYVTPYIIPDAERDSMPTIIGPITFQDPFLPAPSYYEAAIGLDECGGVRIKRISDHDGHNYVFRKTYTYTRPGTDESSGIVMDFNRYFGGLIGPDNPVFNPNIKFPDYNLSKSHVAYSYVTEHYPDGSYVVNRFTDYFEFPDEFSPYKKEFSIGLYAPYIQQNAAYVDFIENIQREPDSRHYRRGLLKTQEWYSRTDSLQRKKEYTYQDSNSSYAAYVVTSGKYIWSARRFLTDFRLSQIKDITYDDGEISLVQSYEYNSLGQVRKELVTDSSGNNGKCVYYRYCHENSASGTSSLTAAVSDIVTTVINDSNEYVIDNVKFEYDAVSKNINPIKKIDYDFVTPLIRNTSVTFDGLFNIGRNYTTRTTNYSYDSLNRITRETFPGNAYAAYVWDAAGNHIIRKEINGSEQSETFVWKDMVGVTKHDFPTNQSENYNYDDKHRLESITDSDGSYLKKFDYYIENE